MHALLITFEADTGPADRRDDHAEARQAAHGLVMRAALRDGATLGGFHLFADRASAEAYLEGDRFAATAANLAFRDFRVRHFDVLGIVDALGIHGDVPLHPPAPP